jgi:hypothetical protein
VIASFHDDFQLTTPLPGWEYVWNSSGPIGDPANYTALIPNMDGDYTPTGGEIPGPAPGAYLNFRLLNGVPGGHPGLAASQGGSGGIARFAIAAFTLPAGDIVSIPNGLIRNRNPNMNGSVDGMTLSVFVNDESVPRITATTAPGFGSETPFSVALGQLSAGSKVYVAVGAKGGDAFDGFDLRYDLVSVPEPGTATFSILCFVILSSVHRCSRIRRQQWLLHTHDGRIA